MVFIVNTNTQKNHTEITNALSKVLEEQKKPILGFFDNLASNVMWAAVGYVGLRSLKTYVDGLEASDCQSSKVDNFLSKSLVKGTVNVVAHPVIYSAACFLVYIKTRD